MPTYRIETAQARYNLDTGYFLMPGAVHFSRPGMNITGDRATGNVKRRRVIITGHVVLNDDGRTVLSGEARSGSPATMTTDELDIDDARLRYTAVGNVHYVQRDRFASARRGMLDQQTHELRLSGDVMLTETSIMIHAQAVTYDVRTTQAFIVGRPVTIYLASLRNRAE